MIPTIRPATDADIEFIQAIYAHHVLTGLGSFELEPPSAAEMRKRHGAIVSAGFPFFVATLDGQVVGYAYASHYRPRPGYRFTVEDSIYIAPAAVSRGVGMALLRQLIDSCTALGHRQMLAVIGDSANSASIRLHERCGFTRVGALTAVGFKFGRWVDSIFMQRALGDGSSTLPTQA